MFNSIWDCEYSESFYSSHFLLHPNIEKFVTGSYMSVLLNILQAPGDILFCNIESINLPMYVHFTRRYQLRKENPYRMLCVCALYLCGMYNKCILLVLVEMCCYMYLLCMKV